MKGQICLLAAGILCGLPVVQTAAAQEAPLAWPATSYFQYNIEKIDFDHSTGAVTVVFSVSNPTGTPSAFWNIKTDAPFTAGGRSSRIGIDIGWDTSDYTNTGSNGGTLNPLTAAGAGAAMPVSINALTASLPCTASDCPGVAATAGRYYVKTTLVPLQFPNGRTVGNGVVAIEGHPACATTLPLCPAKTLIGGVLTPANVPVKSVVKYFSLTGGTPVARRQVVDINKCKKCHDDGLHAGKTIPRLSLHGGNRNEEPALCVVCHNPNQTDIPYRTSGAEVAIDFKRMVHSIHSGGFRTTPFSVVGFQGTVYDFSGVRFPARLSDCTKCHIDSNGKGTFELPLAASVLGTTINTKSVLAPTKSVDVDPNNDLKITPIAAACSGCHDGASIQNHMIRTGGASFSTTQAAAPVERCVSCHGPGREESVRSAHEIGGH